MEQAIEGQDVRINFQEDKLNTMLCIDKPEELEFYGGSGGLNENKYLIVEINRCRGKDYCKTD